MRRVQGLAVIKHESYPRGLPLWLLSCTTFLQEGLGELHCRSTSSLQLSRVNETRYPQSVLFDPLLTGQWLTIDCGAMFIPRNELHNLKDYQTFWYEHLFYIDDLLTHLSISPKARTLRLTARMRYTYEEGWVPKVSPHLGFRCVYSEKIRLDAFELELWPLIKHIYLAPSGSIHCWTEVRNTVVEELS